MFQMNREYILLLLILIATTSIFYGCPALQEAQRLRAERQLAKRNANDLSLAPSDATIKFEPNPTKGNPHGESDHYTLTFAEDLLANKYFDEEVEREQLTTTALGYMESLYNALHDIFGFKPEHKIHVTFYDLYRGTNRVADTWTQYGYAANGRYVAGIKINFPMAMYEKHGVRVHELTHAFTNIYFLPTWFSEGIAVLMQTEYAKGGLHRKLPHLERHLETDSNGVNELENWGGHGEIGSSTQWRYSYAYTLVSELRKRHGDDFYIKVFELMDVDKLHQKLRGEMPTSFLVYYFSRAAGTDLVPFFENLRFKVHKLEESDIPQYIQELNSRTREKSINIR
jgi:hypothetical protein